MLFIVATPIGNLEDLSFRALRVLREADYLLAEDTRVTNKLLAAYEIKDKKIISYHHHTALQKINELIELIKANNVALVTDAGTPGISDPGNKLIADLVAKYPTVAITAVPGPSAVTTALSITGLPTDRFIFKGFIPHKKGKEKFLKEVVDAKETVIFYESPHRILKTLSKLSEFDKNNKQVVLLRELTKKFETIYRGTASQVLAQLQQDFPSDKIKGEFVVALH